MTKVDITFLVNAHAEGLLLIPALQSASTARDICAESGVRVEMMLIADSPDDETRRVATAWRNKIDVVRFVDHSNLSAARTEGLSLGRGEFFCFLDGDDVWQPGWPVAAYRFAQTRNAQSTIYHTEIFAGFGTDHFLRKQIGTDEPLFHPNHLIADWQFCNNLLAHREIFAQFPIQPYDHASGFGSEDWHWSCETCAGGIARVAVPQTVYFYRMDPYKHNLGTVPFLARRETKLFGSDPRVRDYPAFLGAERPSAALLSELNPLRDRHTIRPWLIEQTARATAIEPDLWSLRTRFDTLSIETPQLYVGAALAFGEIARLFDEAGQFGVVFVKTAGREPHVLAKLMRVLSAGATSIPLVIGMDDWSGLQYPVQREGRLLYLDTQFLFNLHGNALSLQHLFTTAIVQFKPAFVLNVEHWLGDSLSNFRASLEHLRVRYCYVGFGDPGDPASQTVRSLFARLTRGAAWYNEIWIGSDAASLHVCRLHEHYDLTRVVMVGASDIGQVLLAAMRNDAPVQQPTRSQHFLTKTLPRALRATPVTSCVLNFHREREVAGPTLRSVLRMLRKTAQAGVATELLLVCDDCDGETRGIVGRFMSSHAHLNVRLLEVAYRDPGLARNAATAAARGEFMCFLDGDDLYSENWIIASLAMMRAQGRCDLILHPELNIYFGEGYRQFWHPTWGRPDTVPHGIIFENYWTAQSFARRRRYLELPYSKVDIAAGFSFEDWHWNLDALSRGWLHAAVPQTCHFIRLKQKGSLNHLSAANRCVVRPSSFLASLVRQG